MMKVFLLASLVLLSSLLFGQEEEGYSFRFALFGLNRVEENLYYKLGEEYHPIGIITSRNKTNNFAYRGVEPIIFALKGTSVELPWIPVSCKEFDKSWHDVYFMLKDQEGVLEIVPFRVDQHIFPYGAYYFINATNLRMGVVMDSEKFFLNNWDIKIVKPSYIESKQMGIQVFTDEGQIIRRINAKWLYRPTVRKIVFIKSEGAGANIIRTHSISDVKN
jgi:hypothetical protein